MRTRFSYRERYSILVADESEPLQALAQVGDLILLVRDDGTTAIFQVFLQDDRGDLHMAPPRLLYPGDDDIVTFPSLAAAHNTIRIWLDNWTALTLLPE